MVVQAAAATATANAGNTAATAILNSLPTLIKGVSLVTTGAAVFAVAYSAEEIPGIANSRTTSEDAEQQALKSASAFYSQGKVVDPIKNQTKSKAIPKVSAKPQKIASDIVQGASLDNFDDFFSQEITTTKAQVINKSIERLATTVKPVSYNASSINPSPTQTKPSVIQSINESAMMREYGRMSHTPVTATAYPVTQIDASKFSSQMQSQQKEAIEAFSQYLSEANPNSETNINNAAVTTVNLPTVQNGKVTNTQVSLFGTTGVSNLMESYHQRAQSAQMPITGMASTAIAATTIPLVVGNATALPTVARMNIGNGMRNARNKLRDLRASLDLSKLMDAITLAMTLHNASMLSVDVVQSSLSVVDNLLALIGLKDEEGNSLDTATAIGKTINDFMTSALGAKTAKDLKEKFAALSLVYRATTNVYSQLSSIAYSTQDVVEVGAQYTGKLGNALRRAGVVGDREDGGFDWMNEEIEVRRGKYSGITDTLENIGEIASDFEQITSEMVSIKDNVTELVKGKAELDKAINDAIKEFSEEDSKIEKASEPPDIGEDDE